MAGLPCLRRGARIRRPRTWLSISAGVVALAVPLASTGVAAAAALGNNPIKSASVNGRVRDLAYNGNILYLVGEFTQATDNGTTVTRNHAAAIDVTTGHLLPWNPNVNGFVYAVAVDPAAGAVYLGGQFTSVGGTTHKRLARVSTTGTGAVATTWNHATNGRVWGLSIGNGRLYAAGEFTTIDTSARAEAAAFSLSTGALDALWKPSAGGGSLRAVAATSTRVYLAGEAGSLDGVAQFGKLGAVNPTTGALDRTFNAKVPYRVFKIEVSSTAVYAAADGNGGHLWSIATNGTTNWKVNADGGIQDVTQIGGLLVVGGHFDNVCNTPAQGSQGACLGGSSQRKKLFAVTTGGVLQSWAPQADSAEGVFTVQSNAAGTQIAVGGDFTGFHFKTVSQPHVAVFAFS